MTAIVRGWDLNITASAALRGSLRKMGLTRESTVISVDDTFCMNDVRVIAHPTEAPFGVAVPQPGAFRLAADVVHEADTNGKLSTFFQVRVNGGRIQWRAH